MAAKVRSGRMAHMVAAMGTMVFLQVLTMVFFVGGIPALASELAPRTDAPAPTTGTVEGTSRQEDVAVSPEEIRDALEKIAVFEQRRQWTDALNLCEEALHRWPKESRIRECFNRCRCHHELARRYADPSFREQLAGTPTSTLRVYEETLSKISLYYVETPSWDVIFSKGHQAFDYALDDETFLKMWPQLTPERITRFRENRGEWMRGLPLTRISEIVVAVRQLGDLAERTLQIPMTAMISEFICGTVLMLDPYSAFLTPNQLRDLFGQIDGNFVGIGVELRIFTNRLVVTRVLPDSPAHKGGLQVGNRLVSVDGVRWDEVTIEQLANRLQGPKGSSVRLEVDRETGIGTMATGGTANTATGITPDSIGTDGGPRLLVLQRDRVDVPSIEDIRFIDAAQGVACMKLTAFQRTTCHELEDSLWMLYREGMRALVIDLRGNPGGLLPASVDAADLFIREGTIVSTRGRNSAEDATYGAHEANTWRVPLVVLIDENSASAAEIFAGAIHEHGRGTIVGNRSYGKGSVQSVVPLVTTGSGLRLTTAKFYSPSGIAYQDTGVSPDVLIHTAARPVGQRETGDDTNNIGSTGDIAADSESTDNRTLSVGVASFQTTDHPATATVTPNTVNPAALQRVPMHTDPVILAAIECLTTNHPTKRLSSTQSTALQP